MQKKRPRLSANQVCFLSLVYKHDPHPGPMLRRQISKDFDLSPRKVQVWFQNRRAKERKILRRKKDASPPA